MGTAYERSCKATCRLKVVEIATLAGEKRAILDTPDSPSELALGAHLDQLDPRPAFSPAACWLRRCLRYWGVMGSLSTKPGI